MNAPHIPIDADKIADNSTLQVMARLSMLATPILITIVSGFAWQWFEAQAKSTIELRSDLNQLSDDNAAVKQRVAVVENNQDRSRRDRESFQERSLGQQEQILQLLRTQGESIAGLNATINAQQRQIEQLFNERRK